MQGGQLLQLATLLLGQCGGPHYLLQSKLTLSGKLRNPGVAVFPAEGSPRDELPPTPGFSGVRLLRVRFTFRWLGAGLGIVSGLFGSIFGFTPGILDLAFG